jgi:hypothetical protein
MVDSSASKITGARSTGKLSASLRLKDRALEAAAEGIVITDATLPEFASAGDSGRHPSWQGIP